jgi:hypothetical protein
MTNECYSCLAAKYLICWTLDAMQLRGFSVVEVDEKRVVYQAGGASDP